MLNISIKDYRIYPDHGNSQSPHAHALHGWHITLSDMDTQLYGLGDTLVWPQFNVTNEEVKGDLQHFEQQCLQLDVTSVLDWAADADIASAARYGIELACFDYMAKKNKRTLATQLWSKSQSEVLCHELLGTTRDIDLGGAELSNAIKLKVGVHPFDEEVQLLNELITKQPKLMLRLDANGAWTYDQARTICDALSGASDLIIEQPLDPRDLRGLDTLQNNTSHIIALDESLVFDEQAALDTSCKQCVVKPMYMGGLRQSQLFVAKAQALQKSICVTHVLESEVGRSGALHFAAGVNDKGPHGVADPLRYEAAVRIPDTVGHGILK